MPRSVVERIVLTLRGIGATVGVDESLRPAAVSTEDQHECRRRWHLEPMSGIDSDQNAVTVGRSTREGSLVEAPLHRASPFGFCSGQFVVR